LTRAVSGSSADVAVGAVEAQRAKPAGLVPVPGAVSLKRRGVVAEGAQGIWLYVLPHLYKGWARAEVKTTQAQQANSRMRLARATVAVIGGTLADE
jgi:hypothetical protein